MYSVDIHSQIKKCDTSPDLYGLFFEDINRAGDGGLYAEMLMNRAFDEGILPEGCTYDPATKFITSPTGWASSFPCYEKEGILGWEALNGAEMTLTDKDTLHVNRKRALNVRFDGGCVRNEGFNDGLFVEEGKSYRFYMFAKTAHSADIRVALTSESGEEYAAHSFTVNGDYARYECILTCNHTDVTERLALSCDAEQVVTLGFVSLFPTDTYMGRENGMRKSLAERLLALKPAFLRFPGGCIVEGFTKETAYRFKDSIGPVWERKPHWLLWAYMTTNGLGYHEYLQFCEDAGIDAMYVFNCGMTCQGRGPDFFDDALVEEFYEDAVQAIEYATAPADTEWGAKRAQNGHPEPFKVLKYLEIGNENWGPEYAKRYKVFYERLKKQYPQFRYISTEHTEFAGLPTEIADEHFYSDPEFFAANTDLYDNIDRSGVGIYCGEYAATIGCKEGNLYGALGEAAFLTGIERNQDKVLMTSYAPLFQNVKYKAWSPDMILFSNHEDYAIPSYYLLEMFGNHRGDYVCDYSVKSDTARQFETGAFAVENDSLSFVSDVCVNGTPCEGITENERTLYGDTTANTQTFNAKVTACSSLHLRLWDCGRNSDDQEHYDWIIADGKSRVIHFNGWSKEVSCPEAACKLHEGSTVEIRTAEDHFEILLDGALLHACTLKAIPHLSAVCTADDKQVITKLVNFSEQEICVQLHHDAAMSGHATLITLTGDSYYAANSFEDKEAVVPVTAEISAAKDYTVTLPARSINVICHEFDARGKSVK